MSSLDYGVDPYTASVTVSDFLDMHEEQLDLPLFLPHELVGGLWRCGWDCFSEVMLGGVAEGIVKRWLRTRLPITAQIRPLQVASLWCDGEDEYMCLYV